MALHSRRTLVSEKESLSMFRQIFAFGLMVLVSMPALALKIGEKAPD